MFPSLSLFIFLSPSLSHFGMGNVLPNRLQFIAKFKDVPSTRNKKEIQFLSDLKTL